MFEDTSTYSEISLANKGDCALSNSFKILISSGDNNLELSILSNLLLISSDKTGSTSTSFPHSLHLK